MDGIAAALLAAEITAVAGCDPGKLYADLAAPPDRPWARLLEAAATPAQKRRLARPSPEQLTATELAGERVESIITRAPGNGAAIGGFKVSAASGRFAAKPSGTEKLYKVDAESFRSPAHLLALLTQAQAMVDAVIGPG